MGDSHLRRSCELAETIREHTGGEQENIQNL